MTWRGKAIAGILTGEGVKNEKNTLNENIGNPYDAADTTIILRYIKKRTGL
jgi:hypothetical protein